MKNYRRDFSAFLYVLWTSTDVEIMTYGAYFNIIDSYMQSLKEDAGLVKSRL